MSIRNNILSMESMYGCNDVISEEGFVGDLWHRFTRIFRGRELEGGTFTKMHDFENILKKTYCDEKWLNNQVFADKPIEFREMYSVGLDVDTGSKFAKYVKDLIKAVEKNVVTADKHLEAFEFIALSNDIQMSDITKKLNSLNSYNWVDVEIDVKSPFEFSKNTVTVQPLDKEGIQNLAEISLELVSNPAFKKASIIINRLTEIYSKIESKNDPTVGETLLQAALVGTVIGLANNKGGSVTGGVMASQIGAKRDRLSAAEKSVIRRIDTLVDDIDHNILRLHETGTLKAVFTYIDSSIK